MNEFNNCFPAGDAFKQSFPGVTASKLRSYMKLWLIEEEPENVIIQVGTNNITKKKQSSEEIAHEILDMVRLCRKNGINNVFISSLVCRPTYQNTIDEVNRILKLNAETQVHFH